MPRPRKPAEVHALAGNPGKRPPGPKAPEGRPFPTRCPRGLDGEARVMWGRLVPVLKRLGYLRIEHQFAVEYACRVWATYLEGDARAGHEFRMMLGSLGLTPASWASIANQLTTPPADTGADPFRRFLSGAAS